MAITILNPGDLAGSASTSAGAGYAYASINSAGEQINVQLTGNGGPSSGSVFQQTMPTSLPAGSPTEIFRQFYGNGHSSDPVPHSTNISFDASTFSPIPPGGTTPYFYFQSVPGAAFLNYRREIHLDLPPGWTASMPPDSSPDPNSHGESGSGPLAPAQAFDGSSETAFNNGTPDGQGLIYHFRGMITIRNELGDPVALIRYEGYTNPGSDIAPPTGPIPCFVTGTEILMSDGTLKKVDDITEGDLVQTRDNGVRMVRWAGSTRLGRKFLQQFPEYRPIRIKANTFGEHDEICVSPQHRALLSHADADLLFGTGSEVLATAKSLAECSAAEVVTDDQAVTYYHLMFDDHEIIRSNGLWTESFNPGRQIIDSMDRQARDEIITLFPDLEDKENALFKDARPMLKPKEVKILLGE